MNRFLLRWPVPLIGGLLALAILFLLYRNLDFFRFLAEISQARPGWILLLVVTILFEFLIHGWKWHRHPPHGAGTRTVRPAGKPTLNPDRFRRRERGTMATG